MWHGPKKEKLEKKKRKTIVTPLGWERGDGKKKAEEARARREGIQGKEKEFSGKTSHEKKDEIPSRNTGKGGASHFKKQRNVETRHGGGSEKRRDCTPAKSLNKREKLGIPTELPKKEEGWAGGRTIEMM